MGDTVINLADISILIVDDSTAIRKIVRQLLERAGITNIREAEDSIEALDRLKMSPSDIAIVDYELGTFTGVDFIRMLRTAKGSPTANIGLVLLTAHKSQNIEDQAREAGADDFLTKPVSADKLKECLEKVLNHRSALHDDTDKGSAVYI